MKNLTLIFVSLILFTSCATQKKTIMLTNGKYISQKKYDKIVDKAFDKAFGKSEYLFTDTNSEIILIIDSTNVK
jgi:major membrane immunogen (membrane-anchored lipoprotein)